MLVGGGLGELNPAELAAITSCLLPSDRPRREGAAKMPAVRGSPALIRAARALWESCAALARASALDAQPVALPGVGVASEPADSASTGHCT